MKYLMLTDVEGVTGVTTYKQAEGTAYGIDMLMNDVCAVLDGVLSIPENAVLIFDEHTDGNNIRLTDLPAEVAVVCGKPLIEGRWQGVDSTFDAVIMVGFHARTGVKGALLPHTYAHWIKNLWINGIVVGEIGMEAALAGEHGVPVVLVTGDSSGIKEAKMLLPGVQTVVVKESLGQFQATCYSTNKTKKLLFDAGVAIGKKLPAVDPLIFSSPVEVRVELVEGSFRENFQALYPDTFIDDKNAVFRADTVSKAWMTYLGHEIEVINRFKL